jgi:flavin reductase (DIM6/NTAB) family NADH-FMN oxidoreductase RutF
LSLEAGALTIGTFGYKSGKDSNKLEKMNVRYGETGVPIVMDDAIAYLECKVTETYDVGTHLMFIGELVQAEVIDDAQDPLTYLHYREVRKGVAPKNAPTYIDKSKLQQKPAEKEYASYECAACGYIYYEEKEGILFNDLPDDWICPLCGSGKDDFVKL